MGIVNGVRDFAVGTGKGIFNSGWKGLKNGLLTAVALGVGVGFLASGIGIGVAILAGVATTALTALPAASYGTSIGAAWGGLFGGSKGLKEGRETAANNVEVKMASAEHRMQVASQQNMDIKTAIGQSHSHSSAGKYQVENHLAAGNEPNKFTNQVAAQKAAAEQSPQVGGRAGK